ncbi:MotA/TolQ/ExbB proton channel family protein [Herbaspirillum lusitanum]|uniref:MotA/TolQ/ExbB proton channel family protein n=1 Tax=Herbaspirillum lusitanum TaxID=213312 RepID=A0ABW9AFI5_9BURK
MNPTEVAAHLSPLQLFLQADVIVKSIMLVLAVASIASWGVALEKLFRFRALEKRARNWIAALAGQRSLARLSNELKAQPEDPFSRIYRAIVGEWRETHKRDLHLSESGRNSLKERINRVGQIATGIEIERLQSGLSILATVGSVAPFIGLLGTVWGIMNSFQGIAASNNTSLSVVAPGIAEALFATALGLVAAIPAVVAYNRASGALNSYNNRLATLIGITEVQLSRQLEAGEPIPEDADAGYHDAQSGRTVSIDQHAHAHKAGGKLAAQGV